MRNCIIRMAAWSLAIKNLKNNVLFAKIPGVLVADC
jgi:hypothetical protein